MALIFRFATANDFAWCSSCADDGFEDHPQLRSVLPRIWGGWRQTGSMMMAMLDDDDLPPPRHVAFATTVFLDADFVDQFLREPVPQLAVQVVQQHRDNRSPVLAVDAIRQANASQNLNLYIIHYTENFPKHYSIESKRGTRNKMMQELLQTHNGYGLRQIIHEFCGEDVLPYSLASGMQLRTDYLDYFARNHLPVPAPEKRPFLVGLNREEEKENWGTALSLLFTPPLNQFRFSRIQQDVLWIAVFEQDDDEWIAKRLGIAVHTVKWRWLSIFETVESVRPGFFDSLSSASRQDAERPKDQPGRGREKRRFLLRYLRQHIGELHPFGEGKR